MILVAATNELPSTVGSLYNKPFTYSIDKNGYIVFKQPKILIAKLKLIEEFFMPEPDHCLYNDLLLDLDVARIDLEIMAGEKEKINKTRNTLIIIGSGLAFIGGLFLGLQISK